MHCPMCKNNDAKQEEYKLENAWDGEFTAVSISCPDCGFRGMAQKKEDDPTGGIAVSSWDLVISKVNLISELAATNPVVTTHGTQNQFFCRFCGFPSISSEKIAKGSHHYNWCVFHRSVQLEKRS